jgi:putative FmdB family regulatory protein
VPDYSYKCTNEECVNNETFTIALRMSEAPLKKCPLCGSEINSIFRCANVNLNFKDSYNSTRSK